MNARLWPLTALVLLCAGMAGVVRAQAQAPQPEAAAPPPPATPQDLFRGDVHQNAGLTCESCHSASASNEYAAIARARIAPLCASCHSDAAVMRRTKPEARIDQYALYQTSAHGQQMAKGEARVATCTDCHGAHGLLPVRDPRSPVAPQNVATTCATCHADQERMEPFEHYGNPEEDWKNSVHANALLQGGDMSAPTCSTCHGSHGPSPALLTSTLVCAECHVREAELYTKSPKKAAFDRLDEPGCLTCHGNHEIEKTSDDWVSMVDSSPCSVCHGDKLKGTSDINAVGQGLGRLSAAIDRAAAVLNQAEVAGMLVDDGLIKLQTAHEQQVLARLTVHAFAAQPFVEIAEQGLAAAAEAEAFGNDALAELRFRRQGLGVATLFILGFLVTLWLKIRRLPPTS